MTIERARELRKSMTPQEVKLWVHLRSWRSRGIHFRRQAPRDGYILDFVCLGSHIIVEVDGGQHGQQLHAGKDRKRDKHFEAERFKILRFWNSDIDHSLDGVLETINCEVAARAAPTPALRADPPPSGEG
jgi:very-short-patch-repair endonuclease